MNDPPLPSPSAPAPKFMEFKRPEWMPSSSRLSLARSQRESLPFASARLATNAPKTDRPGSRSKPLPDATKAPRERIRHTM